MIDPSSVFSVAAPSVIDIKPVVGSRSVGTTAPPDGCSRAQWARPVVEQPQYNLLERRRVEIEYARLYDDIGLGLTTWSPLASGLLTGKYAGGIPDDSRGALPEYGWLARRLTDPAAAAKVERLRPIAKSLGCSLAQLSLAWCAKNPHVTTVITGASRASQVTENFKAIDVLDLLTPDVLARIDEAVGKEA